MRFRLDPKDADAPVEVPIRPAAPPPPAPLRAGPIPADPAPPPASRAGWPRKRWLVVGGVVLLLLAGGVTAALYATNTGPFAYPHAYLVEGSSIPAGMRLADVPQDARDEYGIQSNPGKVPSDRLQDLGDDATRPTDAWVEVLGTRTAPDAVTIVALKFADTDHANTFSSSAALACAQGGHTLLQDGDVLVLVGASSDGSSVSYYQHVVRILMGQASGLTKVC